MSENTIARIMTHMLPTRPASGFTWPSLLLVPHAQHALQTPSQQAQAAQQARDATQPIFFFVVLESALLSLLVCASKAYSDAATIHTVYDGSDFDR